MSNSNTPEDTCETGTCVVITSLKRKGTIVEGPNKKGQYSVQIGGMTMWVAGQDLRIAINNSKTQAPRRKKSLKSSSSSSPTIDLHGRTKQEALEMLETALDRALLAEANSIEIIHGIGTGALRNAIEHYLANSPHVAQYQLLPNNPGTTIAYLR